MNDNVLVSFKWTREELEDYIRSRGGEPDDNTVEDLAGKIRKMLLPEKQKDRPKKLKHAVKLNNKQKVSISKLC